MKILHTDGKNQDFIGLCQLLDENLNEIVGGAEQREKFDPFNQLDDIHDVVVLYQDNEPVGSGSFKYYQDGIAEIKRIFVKKEHRGRGYSKILMGELEKKALEAGYAKFILETGEILQASVALYKSVGFRVIENYGQYRDIPESVCMEKVFVN